MKKDIIFYSNYCTYSKEIINQLSKTPINDNMGISIVAMGSGNAVLSDNPSLTPYVGNGYQDGDTTMIEFVLILDSTQLEGVDILNWRDGKIKELRAYLDIPKG